MLLESIKEEIKKYENSEITDKGNMAIIVMGEGENCSFEEKILIAITLINRIKEKKIKFNSVYKDYLGWNREFRVSNGPEKKALSESIKSIDIAEKLYYEHPEFRNIYFFNLSGNDPKTDYSVKKIQITGFRHTFFSIFS